MEQDRRHVHRMALHHSNTRLVLVIPDTHTAVIGTGDQVGLVSTGIVGNGIDTLRVALERVVGFGGRGARG